MHRNNFVLTKNLIITGNDNINKKTLLSRCNLTHILLVQKYYISIDLLSKQIQFISSTFPIFQCFADICLFPMSYSLFYLAKENNQAVQRAGNQATEAMIFHCNCRGYMLQS